LQVFEENIIKLLEAAPSLVIVITSRSSVLFTSGQITVSMAGIQQLNAEDAEEMVLQLAPRTPTTVAAELAALCGHVPIALSVVSGAVAHSSAAAKVS